MSKRSRTARQTSQVATRRPFPLVAFLGVSALVLALGGILAYAATNQGSGFEDPLKKADKLEGVSVTPSKDLGSTAHTEETVDYGTDQPPVGGKMASGTAPCTVTAAPVRKELAVHSLEHGAVWVTYRPDLPARQISALEDRVKTETQVLLSPYDGLDSPVSAQAWGRRLKLENADDPRLREFIDGYAGGAQAPERSIGC